LAGTRPDLTTVTPTFATPADLAGVVTVLSNIKLSAYCSNSGVKLNSAALAAGGTTGGTYCLNLISLIGSLCSEKYFPLFACTSSPLRVEIQLVSSPLQANCLSSIQTQ
jgi:hypothetical protein